MLSKSVLVFFVILINVFIGSRTRVKISQKFIPVSSWNHDLLFLFLQLVKIIDMISGLEHVIPEDLDQLLGRVRWIQQLTSGSHLCKHWQDRSACTEKGKKESSSFWERTWIYRKIQTFCSPWCPWRPFPCPGAPARSSESCTFWDRIPRPSPIKICSRFVEIQLPVWYSHI